MWVWSNIPEVLLKKVKWHYVTHKLATDLSGAGADNFVNVRMSGQHPSKPPWTCRQCGNTPNTPLPTIIAMTMLD